MSLFRRKKEAPPKKGEGRRVLFISSAISITIKKPDFHSSESIMDGLDFFSIMASQLSIQLHHSSYGYLDMILKVPESKEVANHQLELLNYAFRNIGYYNGILISPFETDKLVAPLVKFMSSNKAFPVCTIDKSFENELLSFKNESLSLPPFVKGHGEENGAIAAQIIHNYLNKNGITIPKIGIVEGLEASEERMKGFEKGMNSFFPSGWHKDNIKEGRFQREAAKREVLNYLRIRNDIDVFFCCNDEMALGTRDALIIMSRETGKNLHSKIFGYDGIRDVTYFIESEDDWILGTIDVKLNDQVKEISKIVGEFINNPEIFLRQYESHEMNYQKHIKGEGIYNKGMLG
jgi:ABC-type sugar transport system substrate-binding protein